jgi:nitrogen regulatory protein P-II 1
MKKIETILNPSSLEAVMDAVGAVGTRGITVTDVATIGSSDLVVKVKVEVVVPDGFVRQVVHAVETSARSAQDDGSGIRVVDVEEAVRIRTGEHGHDVV